MTAPFGFRGGKFVVDRKYGKKVIGYVGWCFGCGKAGHFLLPKDGVKS